MLRICLILIILPASVALVLSIQAKSSKVVAGEHVKTSAEADAVCFRRRLGIIPQTVLDIDPAATPIVQTKPGPKAALMIGFPNNNDTVAPTYVACGTDDAASWPIGTMLDSNDDSYFGMGMGTAWPPGPWQVSFMNVRTSTDYTMVFRIESWITGQSDHKSVKVDTSGGTCPSKGIEKKPQPVNWKGKRGEKIQVADFDTTITAGTKLTVEGTSSSGRKTGVYGLLLGMPATKDKRPIYFSGAAPVSQGKHWSVVFDTAGLEGTYLLRVRRAGTKGDDIDGFDHRTISITK
jgi:hypothetical protein